MQLARWAIGLSVVGLVAGAFVGVSIVERSEPRPSPAQVAAEQRGSTEVVNALSNERVAYYTKVLAALTGALVGFGGAQMMFLVLSDQTARASADAARRSADAAENALVAGNRAFISVTFNAVGHKDVKTDAITSWGFCPTYANTGNTPTRNLLNHVNLEVRDDVLPADWDFRDYWRGKKDDHPVFLPGGAHSTVNGAEIQTSVATLQLVVEKKKRVYLYGWVTYQDVFPHTPTRVTRFAVEVVVGGDPATHDKVSFEFPYLHSYNCSDEECELQGYGRGWDPPEQIA